jgi:ring-1,2-phenylacetyl-CoA epoxidase subunit PaaC
LNSKYLIDYTLHLADNTLVLAQRNAEWCGHGPVLEQDIAITNISLDLLGQSRNFYQLAATLTGDGATEDSLAYLRKEREFKNCLLVEQPNLDWAQSILRQYLFSEYQYILYTRLKEHKNRDMAAIAEKSLKEVIYHVRWSSEWVIRLGDGSDESNQRITRAIQELWKYTGELFEPADYETASSMDISGDKNEWQEKVKRIFAEATLTIPGNVFMHAGGKQGRHTEQLGYILADLQYMQRTYPGAEW